MPRGRDGRHHASEHRGMRATTTVPALLGAAAVLACGAGDGPDAGGDDGPQAHAETGTFPERTTGSSDDDASLFASPDVRSGVTTSRAPGSASPGTPDRPASGDEARGGAASSESAPSRPVAAAPAPRGGTRPAADGASTSRRPRSTVVRRSHSPPRAERGDRRGRPPGAVVRRRQEQREQRLRRQEELRQQRRQRLRQGARTGSGSRPTAASTAPRSAVATSARPRSGSSGEGTLSRPSVTDAHLPGRRFGGIAPYGGFSRLGQRPFGPFPSPGWGYGRRHRPPRGTGLYLRFFGEGYVPLGPVPYRTYRRWRPCFPRRDQGSFFRWNEEDLFRWDDFRRDDGRRYRPRWWSPSPRGLPVGAPWRCPR